MELHIGVRHEESASVISIQGEVDLYTAPTLDEAISKVLDEGHYQLIVDLSDVDFLDSTGLGVLVKALKRCREADGSLAVVAIAERIVKIFKITGLDAVMPLHPSVADAL